MSVSLVFCPSHSGLHPTQSPTAALANSLEVQSLTFQLHTHPFTYCVPNRPSIYAEFNCQEGNIFRARQHPGAPLPLCFTQSSLIPPYCVASISCFLIMNKKKRKKEKLGISPLWIRNAEMCSVLVSYPQLIIGAHLWVFNAHVF